MKPTGSASPKKRRSSAVSVSPAQPRMTARGAFGVGAFGSSGNDAPDIALFQLVAEPLGGSRICHRCGLDAVIYPFVAEISADRRCRKAAENVGIFPLDPLPLLPRSLFAAHRAELKPRSARLRWQLAGGRPRRRRCSRRSGTGRRRSQLLRLVHRSRRHRGWRSDRRWLWRTGCRGLRRRCGGTGQRLLRRRKQVLDSGAGGVVDQIVPIGNLHAARPVRLYLGRAFVGPNQRDFAGCGTGAGMPSSPGDRQTRAHQRTAPSREEPAPHQAPGATAMLAPRHADRRRARAADPD